MKSKRKFSPVFKAQVAIEAIKGQQTLSESSNKYELTPQQISEWKKEFLSKASLVFTKEVPKKGSSKEVTALYEQIGKLKMANECSTPFV